MKKRIYVWVLLILAFASRAQDLEHEKIEWEESPEWVALDSSYSDEQEVVLKFNKVIEFAYAEEYNNRLVEYLTIHRSTRVQGDDAIQSNNKVYIGMYNVLELIEAKARVITPDNKVVNLDKSNILESEGGDGLSGYKYFAIDGVVEGSTIEYIYTVLRVPAYEGIKNDFQDDVINLDMSFTLAAPSNLGFSFKSYNGFPEVVQDTVVEDKNLYTAHVDSMPVFAGEDYAAYGKNLQHLIYKLDKNTYTGTYNVVSFGEVAQNVFGFYNDEIAKSDVKKLKKLINESGAGKASSEEEKIRLLERYVKSNIGIIDGVETKSIAEILSDGFTSERGMILITIQALKQMEIKHEMVLTCDRYDDIFDEDFEHYQVLKYIAIYFPKIKKYMAPADELYRLGMIPDEWTNQKGLFIKEVAVGDIKTGLGKVKFIEPLSSAYTKDLMDLTVDFSDVAQPVVEFRKEISGYSSVGFQGIYNLIDEESKKELDEALIKFSDENGEVLNYEVSGVDEEDCGVNPMVYTGKLKTTSVMEKAGNRYLFKVGELIGPQMEMYQEEERVLDIEHSHNMVYDRTIRFTIPDGFEVSGLDDLNIKEYYPLEKPVIKFESTYTQNGNEIEVKIIEQYDQISFTKDEINDFRRIINAAANFNKVVLFMTKK